MASIPVIQTFYKKMFEPEHMELAQVLQNGLKKHFEEATAKWVDCPNLTKAPFYLAAEGLCGDTMLLKVGSESNMFCHIPQMQMRYEFKNILKSINNNYSAGLIIGAGFTVRNSTQQLSKLHMNASFLRMMQNHYLIFNTSQLGFRNYLTGQYVYETINDLDPACYMYGNFFISEAKPGKVLRVYAKKPLTQFPFAVALLQVLSQKYCPLLASLSSFDKMGLGGTFLTKYGITNQTVIHSYDDQFNTSENINNWLFHANFYFPGKTNGTIHIEKNNCNNYFLLSQKQKYESSEFDLFKLRSSFPHGVDVIEPNVTMEFLGYFYPTKTLYHVDP